MVFLMVFSSLIMSFYESYDVLNLVVKISVKAAMTCYRSYRIGT